MAFNMNLRFKSDGLSITAPCSYSALAVEELKDKMKVKAMADGKAVALKTMVGDKPATFTKAWVDSDGKIVDRSEVKYFAEVDGKEVEVEKFERTKDMEVFGTMEEDKLCDFVCEGWYEIYAKKNIGDLWKIAEFLSTKKKIGLAKFSFGNGFKMYLSLIRAVIRDGKFCLEMSLAVSQKRYSNLMDIKTIEVKNTRKTLDML